jgi:hypothetical protein
MPTQAQKTIRNTRSLHPCSLTGLSVVARDLCMPEQVTSAPRLFGSRLLSARALQFFCPPDRRIQRCLDIDQRIDVVTDRESSVRL